MDDVTMVQQMTGCTRDEAEKALVAHETVLDAIEALIPANPVTSGARYIPPNIVFKYEDLLLAPC